MVVLKRVLGVLWVLPMAVIAWVLYLLPFWTLGWYRLEGRYRHAAWFSVSPKAPLWLQGLWFGWAGHAMPLAIVTSSPDPLVETQRHELRHCEQWLMWGPLFPVLYITFLLWYGYRQHPMELDAQEHE